MEKSILLFSGGIDSFIAYHYLQKPRTLYFNLGTPYSEKALRVVQKLIPETIIDNSLNLGDRQIGDKAYIPFRNLILACMAYKYDDRIIIAGVKDDMVSDKNEVAFGLFSLLLSQLENKSVKVVSPFWDMTKEDCVRWYLKQGGSIQSLLDTISCYSDENTNYCGKCPSCFRKWCALSINGIHPPFFNRKLMLEYYNQAKAGLYIEERNKSIIRCVEAYCRNS